MVGYLEKIGAFSNQSRSDKKSTHSQSAYLVNQLRLISIGLLSQTKRIYIANKKAPSL
jgi:hypothetical protein